MTDQHPLTDEICDQIQDSVHPCDPENMRTAADWQLEQVIEWMEANLMNHDFYKGYAYLCDNFPNVYIKEYELLEDLRESMRPTTTTTQENNNG
jgi:hypothetical protein